MVAGDPLVALGQCFAWFYLVWSYRLLNSAKYQVVGALEERLPASPFWAAEWWALGEGTNRPSTVLAALAHRAVDPHSLRPCLCLGGRRHFSCLAGRAHDVRGRCG
jgi:hypothetical protein